MKTRLLVSVLVLVPCATRAADAAAPASDVTLIKAAVLGDAAAQANLGKLIEQLRQELRTAQQERAALVRDNQRLFDEVRRLNQTLDSIRSQLGNGEVRPTAR
jgi:Skp family chaperone for outer membrane proteins